MKSHENHLHESKRDWSQHRPVPFPLEILSFFCLETIAFRGSARHSIYPGLMGLVDEFYFEHHVNTEPMHRYWGTQGAPQTLADSYRIFKALHAKGVMAHAWV